MMLRMFLKVIEDFHLKMTEVKGPTISIGGEMKKMKITNHLSIKNLKNNIALASTQGTEDATKWNEALAPSPFALMHK